MTTTMTKEEADQFIASGEVAASVVRAFEEAARIGREAIAEDRADPVRLMSEAFERAQAALPSNVLPFVRRGAA
ncbi:hypothetical protein [Methylobacterium sp. E-045]|uniref:hypothetical protein n=1 Tax=Methylobacterium sp. E-045 TaxID=2836575 RepID=UPI001FB91199|nr:hypothetical protein [Methylobacterium sp. E-045]MCJ2129346.1 hypothetical protein [Methylobacterium sp. E-045]